MGTGRSSVWSHEQPQKMFVPADNTTNQFFDLCQEALSKTITAILEGLALISFVDGQS